MSPTPKRYQFDNQVPTFEPRSLPARRPSVAPAEVVPDYTADQAFSVYAEEAGMRPQQVIHVHQAPPDRTLQRLAMGAGVGAGTVVGAVYAGPMLAASLWTIVIIFAIGGLVLAVIVRGITAILGTEQTKGRRRR
ncbi:DUF6251 family protein [Actinacidiphila acidipaludis]|uniref:COX20 family protein n=1 Tax=Actinacidiphila acidipaludis TaxID=2873382 RepID=A0ABS7QBB3_9ACTN|nr:DUF6251 family protein [Streptomyces acidipaludis]MBY8879735.1 COX20 family protein [Streptomyces acidipaludis]